MSRTDNPYSSPRASSRKPRAEPGTPQYEAEQLRRKYLKHEDSLKKVGFSLYLFGAIFGLIVIVNIGRATNGIAVARDEIFLSIFSGVMCPLLFVLGRGLRRFDPRIIIPATIWSCVVLLLVPVGTLIGGVTLFLIHGENGKAVFTEEYREAIRLTSEIKAPVPMTTWVKLIVTIVFCFGLLIAAILSRK